MTDEERARLILRVERGLHKLVQTAFPNVTVMGLEILGAILDGKTNVKDLTRALSSSHATISNLVEDLERAGLVSRLEYTGGGKSRIITITEKGTELFRQFSEKMKAAYSPRITRYGIPEGHFERALLITVGTCKP